MNIAVLSGKGGTGKTFVSVNLAAVIPRATYIDCDVEEPNGHLFLKPSRTKTDTVCILLPEIDEAKCNGCRKCVDFCHFNALAFIKERPMKFKDVCHACGGCKIVCTQKAIYEKAYPIGEIKTGMHGDITVVTGVMHAGEESGVPIIRKMMGALQKGTNIIDCPPGSACTVMESIEKADYCILVAEPTVFGVHNFLMVYELVQLLHKPFGVIINKDMQSDANPMLQLCKEKNLPMLWRIGYDARIAKSNAEGKIAVDNYSALRADFEALYAKIKAEVGA